MRTRQPGILFRILEIKSIINLQLIDLPSSHLLIGESQFWNFGYHQPKIPISAKYHNIDQISQFQQNFTISAKYHNFSHISQYQPNLTITSQISQNFTQNTKLKKKSKRSSPYSSKKNEGQKMQVRSEFYSCIGPTASPGRPKERESRLSFSQTNLFIHSSNLRPIFSVFSRNFNHKKIIRI